MILSHDELIEKLKEAGVDQDEINTRHEEEGSLGLEDLATEHLGYCDYDDLVEHFYLKPKNTKEKIKAKCEEIIPQVVEKIKQRIEHLVRCGGYDPETEGEIVPKAIMYVATKDAANAMLPLSKECKALAKNLECF